MDDENRNRKKAINLVKEHYDIQPLSKFKFDLSQFLISNKGKYFRHLYTWKIEDFINDSYLFSLRNSYEAESLNNYYFFEKNHISGRYLSLLIESKTNLPNLIIRPASLADKISNIFLKHDIKLKDRSKFNKKFILESDSSSVDFDNLISKDLSNLIEQQDNLYIEFSGSKVLIKLEQEMESQGALDIVKIGLLIDEKIKNVA